MATIDLTYLKDNIGKGNNEPDDLGEWEEEYSVPIGTVKFKLTEPQSRFISLTCPNPLFVGGYGSGKTTIKCIAAIQDITQFPGGNVALYDPTFDQIGLNTAPRLIELLEELKLPFHYNKSSQIIEVVGYGKLIMRSMNNPERIVGYEVFRSHVDEIGVVNPGKVQDVWNKIVARNRQKVAVLDAQDRKVIDIKTRRPLNQQNKISAYGTPDDGFGFTYNMWGKNPADGYEYVRASTRDNAANLPDDYIPSLYRIYPEGLVDAFIEGIWCNFTTGSIYYGYNRDDCRTDYTIVDGEQLHIGMDFNVYHMAATIGVLRKGKLYILDELIDLRDTPDMILAIKNKFPNHNVTVYPDSSGKSKSSKGVTLSDHKLLRDAGFTVKAKSANPRVNERIASVNAGFEKGNVYINDTTAPQTAESVEQQTYDGGGLPDKKTGLDHRNDALGYLIHWFFALRKPTVTRLGVKTI
jgi:hypothetical protein